MITIKPNRIIQILLITSPLIGFILISSLLVQTVIDAFHQLVTIFLFISWGITGLFFRCILFHVWNAKIISSSQGVKFGYQKLIPWPEISRIEPTVGSGRYAGIRVYFNRNIYRELPFWRRPLVSKEQYHIDYNTGMLFYKSSHDIVNEIIKGKQ